MVWVLCKIFLAGDMKCDEDYLGIMKMTDKWGMLGVKRGKVKRLTEDTLRKMVSSGFSQNEPSTSDNICNKKSSYWFSQSKRWVMDSHLTKVNMLKGYGFSQNEMKGYRFSHNKENMFWLLKEQK